MIVWVQLYPCVLQITSPKKAVFFCHGAAILNTKKTQNNITLRKKVKMIIDVDKWLDSLYKRCYFLKISTASIKFNKKYWEKRDWQK